MCVVGKQLAPIFPFFNCIYVFHPLLYNAQEWFLSLEGFNQVGFSPMWRKTSSKAFDDHPQPRGGLNVCGFLYRIAQNRHEAYNKIQKESERKSFVCRSVSGEKFLCPLKSSMLRLAKINELRRSALERIIIRRK